MRGNFSTLSAELQQLKQQNLYRSRRLVDTPQGVHSQVDGVLKLNFCSNDYLGLANHPEVVRAFQAAASQWGVGSGSAHLVCGHTREHHALEEELADFTGRDRALLFSTGYMANTGIIAALVGRGDTVLEDRLNHASLLDGGLLSGARFRRYAHADSAHLQRTLLAGQGRQLIVTDGVFSMDGDCAPLSSLVIAAKAHDAWLMVDDAHGFGVLGATGAGVVECAGLSQQDVPVLVGTLGKAFGTSGAFVAGSELLIETLIQKARPYIYTTAMPAAIAAATRVSLRLLIAENWRRDKLAQLVQQFRQGATQLGLQLMPSLSPIQPIVVGSSQQALWMSEQLLQRGFLVSAIRPPTVPQGSARLRITFSAAHDASQVTQLLAALQQIQ
ncbi:MAG: 8-amino-7-oxononanoate synthase [Methylococcales bacterium]|nr:8-amino-7-oxononanoate synthase [Methylococcales bacterium]